MVIHLRATAGRIEGTSALLLPAGALQVVEVVSLGAEHWAGRRHRVALYRHPHPSPVRVQRLQQRLIECMHAHIDETCVRAALHH